MPFRVLLTFSLLYYTKLIKQYPYPNEQISFSGVSLSIDACSFLPDRQCCSWLVINAINVPAVLQCCFQLIINYSNAHAVPGLSATPSTSLLYLNATSSLSSTSATPMLSWIVSNAINVLAASGLSSTSMLLHAFLQLPQSVVVNLNAAPSLL